MRVLVLFGGRSSEHEVSVASARCVKQALGEAGHEVVTVGIDRRGRFLRADPDTSDTVSGGEPYEFVLDPDATRGFDVVFPVLHGPWGEDGSIQGAFDTAGIPYVGSGVEASTIGMNKVVHKTMFRAVGLPIVDFAAFTHAHWVGDPAGITASLVEQVGLPMFVKPSRMGSSVGISKVADALEVGPAIDRAFIHDTLVIVEKAAGSRELEVGVLDGDQPQMSVVGEIVCAQGFYDYASKYTAGGAELRVPAEISEELTERIQEFAARAFDVCGARGLARVDFFYDEATDDLRVNEINTMPGLTPLSMFPRVWEASGVTLPQVCDHLVKGAMRAFMARSALEAGRLEAHLAEVGSQNANW